MDAAAPTMTYRAAEAIVSPTSPTNASATALTFAEVYREYFGFVWRGAQGLGVHPPAIEDVVQEIFIVVHRLLPEFEGRLALRSWLSKIVLNVVRHHRRSVVRKSPHELAREESEDPDALATRALDPYETAALSEGTRLVQQLLDTLDDEKREVFVLAEIEEVTVPEIAEALGLKLNTAYSRLRLARQEFELALVRHHAHDRRRRP